MMMMFSLSSPAYPVGVRYAAIDSVDGNQFWFCFTVLLPRQSMLPILSTHLLPSVINRGHDDNPISGTCRS